MHAQNWTDVLTLLSMMIMGDGDKKNSNSKKFTKAAVKLRDAINPGVTLTEEMAYDWFTHRRDTITKNMSSVYYAATIERLIGNLNSLPNKKELILQMIKAGLNEDENPPTENRIFERACEAWELDIALTA